MARWWAIEAGAGSTRPEERLTMSVKVYIPTPFRTLTGGQARVETEAHDVKGLLGDLETRFPGMRDRLRDEHGALHRREHETGRPRPRSLARDRVDRRPSRRRRDVPRLYGAVIVVKMTSPVVSDAAQPRHDDAVLHEDRDVTRIPSPEPEEPQGGQVVDAAAPARVEKGGPHQLRSGHGARRENHHARAGRRPPLSPQLAADVVVRHAEVLELRYLHRPANHDDVFLRLTGRDLRD